MKWIRDHFTKYQWGHGTIPPWLGIGPVYWGTQLTGVSVSVGRHCLALHKNVSKLAEENKHG